MTTRLAQRILPTALELEERDLLLLGQPRERPALDYWTIAKRGDRSRWRHAPDPSGAAMLNIALPASNASLARRQGASGSTVRPRIV